jgi:Holliday junction resolvasome RuvABC endonuclease subunit
MPKKQNAPRILAIDPGTRKMGIAILERKELIYSAVKVLKRTIPHELLEEAKRTILRLIDDFKPEFLAVEKPFFFQYKRLRLLATLVEEIEILGRKRKLKVFAYFPKTIRKLLVGDGNATKEQVARVLAAKYPDLTIYLRQDRLWKEKHWQNMFDAIAVGLTCFHKGLGQCPGSRQAEGRPGVRKLMSRRTLLARASRKKSAPLAPTR